MLAAVLVAGGVLVALLGHGGRGSLLPREPARSGLARDQLAVASAYLGLPPQRLRSELAAGRSLEQIARRTPGRSASGLKGALVAARARTLDASARKLSPPARAKLLASARRRATAVLRRRGTPLPVGAVNIAVAARYLDLPPVRLTSLMAAGRSLAQVAAATPGRSAAGAIDAIVAARESGLARALRAGSVTAAQAARVRSKLRARVTAAVERVPIR